MVINQKETYKVGFNPICDRKELHEDMFMDIGVVKLSKGDVFSNEKPVERAILLIEGQVTFEWDGQSIIAKRESCFDENPICLHLPKGVKVTITGLADTDLMYQAVENDNEFNSKLYGMEDTVTDVFGKDVLGNTSIRSVRTIIDDSIAPYSNLVMGEVINHPGKWSSYPPHHHVQPEVYHYRFLPDTGFGFSLIGDEAQKVEHCSTSLVTPSVVHPQCSAPGYAMYYVWMIPHTPKRWLKDRTFEEKHTWLLEDDAKVWPYEN